METTSTNMYMHTLCTLHTAHCTLYIAMFILFALNQNTSILILLFFPLFNSKYFHSFKHFKYVFILSTKHTIQSTHVAALAVYASANTNAYTLYCFRLIERMKIYCQMCVVFQINYCIFAGCVCARPFTLLSYATNSLYARME